MKLVHDTPLHRWFNEDMIWVNSYHHQGVRRLAQRFVAMAHANDGLIEGFYDRDAYNPEEGKFIMGLQFHPERMRNEESGEFDYPGCTFAYKEFVKAVIAYQKKVNAVACADEKPLRMNKEMENQRDVIVRSFSIAKNLYTGKSMNQHFQESELEAGAQFLEVHIYIYI